MSLSVQRLLNCQTLLSVHRRSDDDVVAEQNREVDLGGTHAARVTRALRPRCSALEIERHGAVRSSRDVDAGTQPRLFRDQIAEADTTRRRRRDTRDASPTLRIPADAAECHSGPSPSESTLTFDFHQHHDVVRELRGCNPRIARYGVSKNGTSPHAERALIRAPSIVRLVGRA